MTDEELKRLFEAIDRRHEQTDRHFDVVAERLEKRIDAVAEAVSIVDKKLDRTAVEIRTEIRRESDETRALLRLSYSELERRLSTLEERVDRLEALVRPPQA